MILKRFATYVALALCACFGSSFASAMERPIQYLVSSFEQIGELQSSAMTRMELTLASWRTGVGAGDQAQKSNMRAESNHFVMVSAAPAGVPDWDAATTA
ncbi:hypothetical protein [Pseudomonas sp. SDO55104_S430]